MKKYNLGSVFLVPLDKERASPGVVARTARGGKIVFAYFFPPELIQTEGIDIDSLAADHALFAERIGDLGLVKGAWPVVGRIADLDRSAWPMPATVRRDPLGKRKPTRIIYDDDDAGEVIGEEVLTADDPSLPNDGLSGYKYIEAKLNKLIV